MAVKKKTQSKDQLNYAGLMKELKSGRLRNVYLLYGEETYLIRHLLNTILDLALAPSTKDLDCRKLDVRSKPSTLRFSELADELRTPAFLSPRRVLILEDTNLFQSGSASYQDQCLELLDACSDYAVLIFVESKVDKRSRKLLNEISARGAAVECQPEELSTLIDWSRHFLKRYGIELRPSAAESLVERCGRSMQMLKNELQKISLACRGEGRDVVDEHYVDAVSIQDIRAGIFQLSDAVAAGQPEEALRLYRNLLEQKSAPQYILFMLARHFRQLLTAQNCPNTKQLMETLDCGRFVADKLWKQRNRFSPAQCRYIYLLCADSDWQIKSGQNDEQSALELLLLQALRPPLD